MGPHFSSYFLAVISLIQSVYHISLAPLPLLLVKIKKSLSSRKPFSLMVFVQWSKGFRPLVHKDLSIALQVVQWILKLLLLFDRVYACLFSFVSATEKSFKSSAKSSSATPPLAKLVWGIGDSEAVAPQLLPVRPWQLNCESHNSLTYIYLLFTCPSYITIYRHHSFLWKKKYKNSSKKKRERRYWLLSHDIL